jgi:hypothetical protein
MTEHEKRGVTKSLWCSKVRSVIMSRKCLAVWTRGKVTIPGASIVVKVCGLDSEATFDFAKNSVYDTSLGQSSNCDVALKS